MTSPKVVPGIIDKRILILFLHIKSRKMKKIKLKDLAGDTSPEVVPYIRKCLGQYR